jgi:hypothetical protein
VPPSNDALHLPPSSAVGCWNRVQWGIRIRKLGIVWMEELETTGVDPRGDFAQFRRQVKPYRRAFDLKDPIGAHHPSIGQLVRKLVVRRMLRLGIQMGAFLGAWVLPMSNPEVRTLPGMKWERIKFGTHTPFHTFRT